MSPALEININTLRRYKLIQDLYTAKKTPDIPLAKVHRNYIYPVYPISRMTLYNILNTPVDRYLKEAEAAEEKRKKLKQQQTALF